MQAVGPRESGYSWRFSKLSTDYPLTNARSGKMRRSSLYIDGDQALVVGGRYRKNMDWNVVPHARFPVCTISAVGANETGAKIVSHEMQGALGVLVAGGCQIVITLQSGYCFAFKVGMKTGRARRKSVMMAGEIKRVVSSVLLSAAPTAANSNETMICPS